MGMIPSKKVFVSSTTKDLWQYREEATKVISKLSNEYKNRIHLVEVTMDTEALDGERKPAVERSKGWVDECDWIVLIVAWNYGYVPPNEECSVTEWEYRQAEKGSKPCFIFLAGESDDGEKEYFPIKGREKVVLSDWRTRENQSENDANRLKQFKNDLRKKDFNIFSDVDDFLQQLESSLKKRIDLLLCSYGGDLKYFAQVYGKSEESNQSVIDDSKYFFSYARKDSEFVLRLAQELREKGVNLWLDQLDIIGGERWDRAVENALAKSRGIVVVLSPDSEVSNSVMDEVSYALEEGKLVVPILYRPCKIPFRLRRLQRVDFTGDYNTGFSQLLRALRIGGHPGWGEGTST